MLRPTYSHAVAEHDPERRMPPEGGELAIRML
jgi:hypothetical protein